ncbi:MAG: TonB-dependent receptor [Proteobacteria bacterium]|nr:TonB-dependent receptor [Pseudomonadota bacterium]
MTESLSPIDVITSQDLDKQGYAEMDDLLRTTVPSFQVNSHPIDDAGTLVRPAKLRGLAPDQTLILVNGQRRHRSSVINFISDALTEGVQGPDLSVIPTGALDRVEVLRDGAAAQYGSDAIAGVINFILKDDPSGGTIEAKYGESLEGDGETKELRTNFGLPLGERGFVNVTADYLEQDETIRNVLRNDVAELIAKRQLVGRDTSGLDSDTQIWGGPIIHDSLNLFVNSGYEISEKVNLYAFGSYAQREVEGGFYYRNPDTRNGVFDTGSGSTPRVVGALNEMAFMNDACAQYRLIPSASSDGAAAVQADFDSLDALAADPNCFSHNAAYPNGFTPRFGGDVTDYSLSGGLKGELDMGLRYDFSVYYGQNEADFFIFNTVNSARGPAQPGGAHFDPGTYIQSETSLQANFGHLFDVGFLASPLHVAFGAEWREEAFEIEAGDMFSVSSGNAATCGRRVEALRDGNTPERTEPCTVEELLAFQGFTPASNGFSGFSPQTAGEWERYNTSFYLDLETDLSDAFSVGAALRFEDYEDFGSTTKGKLAGRLRLSDSFGLRGTVQTGFRAPTPGQSNVSNVSTVFDASVGDLVEEGLTPPTDPVAALKGGKALEPEESLGFTLGFDWTSEFGLALTVDAFLIEVDDRLATSAKFALTAEDVEFLQSQNVSGVRPGSTLRYFTNAWDTETKGVELVASWGLDMGLPGGDTDFSLAASYIDTEVTSYDETTAIDIRRLFNIENLLPKDRAVLTANHYVGNWSFMGRISWWGDWEVMDAGRGCHVDDPPADCGPDSYNGEFLFDVEASYRFESGVTLVAGGQNIFDAFPDRHPRGAGDSGQAYHEHSPFGFNGGFWYTRLRYDF